ncbi:oligosaccharide flippase family protein [Porphyromonas pogonae]|uniref:oligosaccharide flippase family protein n=1 Tax=Porphyromonas pogonae TaxID=867595 RepID=UPI002E799A23|nr:oligosaccharide flippase family protein [Porphyromonas pogonae]
MGVVLRQSIKGTIITYTGAFIGFITTFFILTSYLTTEEIGLTRVLLEVATLLSGFSMMGMTSSIFRFFPYFKDSPDNPHCPEHGPHHGFFYYLIKVALGGALIVIPLYLILQAPISSFFSRNSALFNTYYYQVIPLSLCLLFWLTFELYAVQLMRIAIPKFIREILLRLLLIVVYLLYAFHHISLSVFIYLFVASYGLCMIFALIYLRSITPLSFKHESTYITQEIKHSFFKYTGLYVVASFGSTLASRMDLFMVSSIDSGGLNSAGIFSIAFFIVAIIEIPSRSILSISTPGMADAMKNNDIDRVNNLYKQITLYQFFTGAIIFLLIWFNIDTIFAIIPNGHIYSQGKWVVFFLGLAKLVELTFNYGNPIVSCSKYYHWNLYYTFLVTTLSIVSNLIFIPQLGIVGAAVATLITMSISYGVQQILISWRIKANPFSLNYFKIILLLSVVVGINFCIPFLFNKWLDLFFRSIIVIFIVTILAYYLRVVPEFFQKIKTKRGF